MTRVEFLQAVVDNAITEDVMAYAKVRLDKENDRKSSAKAESDAKRAVALAGLTDTYKTAKEIAEGTEYTARQVQYYLGVLVKEGVAVKNDATPKGYKLAEGE